MSFLTRTAISLHRPTLHRRNHLNNLAMSQSSQATPSNHLSTETVLRERRILWRKLTDAEITKQESTDFSFESEWGKFAKCCGIQPDSIWYSSGVAWNSCFSRVMKGTYAQEQDFDVALFNALKESLSEVADPQSVMYDTNKNIKEFLLETKNGKNDNNNESLLKLSSRNIGFCRRADRTRIGFKIYGISKQSFVDHACFVKSDASADFTASIELKTSESSPMRFEEEERGEKRTLVVAMEPDLVHDHGAIGQALIYTMDNWHCLARRGINLEKLPVTVLACKLKTTPPVNRHLCVEAWLHIPKYTGDRFCYTINRFPRFHIPDDDEIYKTAIAVYIRALRIGVERGMQIISRWNDLPPISLCCRTLKIGVKEFVAAELVASPIPDASPIVGGFTIGQGELFKLNIASESAKQSLYLSDLGDDVYYYADNGTVLSDQLLVKVSCISVHSTLIPLMACDKALDRLDLIADASLKEKIAEVLLAAWYTNNTLVTVMTDLSDKKYPGGAFGLLSPKKISEENKLPALWSGLEVLVKRILLPLADKKIIHADIRPSWEKTFNILCRKVENKFELRLIDYESLHMQSYSVINKNTISSHGEQSNMSSHEYEWWLVLWIAYKWHSSTTNNDYDSKQFVKDLFPSSRYESFTNSI
jgi:hypothetical protein